MPLIDGVISLRLGWDVAGSGTMKLKSKVKAKKLVARRVRGGIAVATSIRAGRTRIKEL